jgi:hypothetical protein
MIPIRIIQEIIVFKHKSQGAHNFTELNHKITKQKLENLENGEIGEWKTI